MALNIQQESAVWARGNTVVTAGAGSGKTTVLAQRYTHLVMHDRLSVDQILTLTFTNKAANEMYERIYRTLSENRDNQYAKKAVDDFYNVHIETIDSFCAKIARSGSALFGIAPDFSQGNEGLEETVSDTALAFVLDNRGNSALQAIAADKKIKTIAENLFAQLHILWGTITKPPDFSEMLDIQLDILRRDYATLSAFFAGLLAEKKIDVCIPQLDTLLAASGEDDAKLKEEIETWCHALDTIRGNRDEKNRFAEMMNFALQIPTVEGMYALLGVFQKQCNHRKRMAGLLSFSDTAQLAVDTLLEFPEIRRIYKTQFKAIMIDEFQDNNSLQKQLLFLLAEREDRMEKGMPERADITPSKLFFVGDEKQSIYRFRGADVSVFRTLEDELPENANGTTIHLETNYRSRPELIDAFNIIFRHVFAVRGRSPQNYDACFRELSAGKAKTGAASKFIHFAFHKPEHIEESKTAALSKNELEAVYIARKIREMVGSWTVLKKEDGREVEAPCAYSDIAILIRKRSRQNNLERQLKNFGIPYNTDEPASLFDDVCIKDMVSYIRLMVYPRDLLSYAAVLRSPFARLNDTSVAVCLLDFNKIPFDENQAQKLDAEDRQKFLEAGKLWRESRRQMNSGELCIAEFVTKLWYELGLRYEVLHSAKKENLLELYDYFFEFACTMDAQGKTLSRFLSYIEELSCKRSRERKLDGLDVPVERSLGVRILTIHKSKGLEFPVVFVSGCGDDEKTQVNDRTYCALNAMPFVQDKLLSLNLPHSPYLKGDKPGNYFHAKFKETEERMSEAELRRLLYVAATRAESQLFFVGTFPKATKAEAESKLYAEDPPLVRRIKLYADKIEASCNARSFLNLFVSALADEKDELWSLESVPALQSSQLRALVRELKYTDENKAHLGDMESKRLAAQEIYGSVAVEPRESPAIVYKNPSDAVQASPGPGNGPFSIKARTCATNLGTMVHSMIEDRFKGIYPAHCEKGILKRAAELSETFFLSEIGKKSLAATWRKTEFAFISLEEQDGKKIYINGKIDLLFREGNTIYIVDYKTDKTMNSDIHIPQLERYTNAVKNLFPDASGFRAFIFYVRHKVCVEVVYCSAR